MAKSKKMKLNIVNERMFRWMEHAVTMKICDNQKDWCQRIGFPHTNISQVKSGVQSFTLSQIEQAARLVKGNMNWLWDFEPNMLRTSKPLSPMELLQQATVAIEQQLDINRLAGKTPPPLKQQEVNKQVNKRAGSNAKLKEA